MLQMHKTNIAASTLALLAAASPWARLPHPLLRGVIEIQLFTEVRWSHMAAWPS
jgi:hypothetical protein